MGGEEEAVVEAGASGAEVQAGAYDLTGKARRAACRSCAARRRAAPRLPRQWRKT
jgi:hypothetical protein